jgi:hypothetical protein
MMMSNPEAVYDIFRQRQRELLDEACRYRRVARLRHRRRG